MGPLKAGISEKELMRQLAEERRATRPKELAERNRKIGEMLRLGCSYEDIGRRYGVSPGRINQLVKERKIEKGVLSYFRGAGDICRAGFVD